MWVIHIMSVLLCVAVLIFGVKGVISPDSSVLESGAAVRTAEGGAEYIQGIDADNFAQTLEQFKQAGYTF